MILASSFLAAVECWRPFGTRFFPKIETGGRLFGNSIKEKLSHDSPIYIAVKHLPADLRLEFD